MSRPGGRRRTRRKWRLGAAAMVIALAVWGTGLFRFAETIPKAVADADAPTDAIVVLTGGRGRLSTGLDLLARQRAKRLFVSGVYQTVDVGKLFELSRNVSEELRCCVEVGHSADDTAGNAAETAAWVRKNGVRSLRIVTSGYHMPRSLLEFRRAMPGVTLVPHPVFSQHVKQQRWWAWPGTAILIIGEYNKFLLANFLHLVGPRLDSGEDQGGEKGGDRPS